MFTAARPHASGIAGVLMLAMLVLIGASWSRGTEYDEDYSIFISAGTPRPVWPAGIFTPRDVRGFYAGRSTLTSIATDLRRTDVHPPLYFWSVAAWRGVVGTGLFRTRLLSVCFSLAALVGVARLAKRVGAPPIVAMLLTLGCYGFTYTGSIARDFAMAQLCVIWGTLLIMLAAEARLSRQAAALGFAAGLLLGLASFANYLAIFEGMGALLWLLLTHTKQWPRWLAAGIGFTCLLPADMFFFLAQRGSRAGQFPPFQLLPSLARLGKYAAANVFGGLPLYVGHVAGVLLGALLVMALGALAIMVALRWPRIGNPDAQAMGQRSAQSLLLIGTLATPMGLMLLGFIFNNTPIELRYIAFATPFFALLLAGTFASLPRPAGQMALAAMLCVQAVSIAGLVTRSETMQPQAQAARAASALAKGNALTLVPHGNDGVGVLAAFVNESAAGLRIRAIQPGESAILIAGSAAGADRVVLVLLGLDADSRSVLPAMRQAFETNPCWRRAASGFDVLAFDRDPSCIGNKPAS